MDFKVIPHVFNTVEQDLSEKPRDIAAMANFLEWSYELFDHPVFKQWRTFQAMDAFDMRKFSAEQYVRFNRTVLVRTVNQAKQCARTPIFEDRGLCINGKDIEMNIGALHSIWYELNGLLEMKEFDRRDHQASVALLRLKLQVQLIHVAQFFLFDCNEMIFIHMKHHIQVELQKIVIHRDRIAYLLKAQKDTLSQKDQLWESVFTRLMDHIHIELAYYKALKENERIDTTNELFRAFMEETSSRISSGKLLGYLLTDQIDRFCADLKEFAMRVLSTHDVGGKDPEKVYHLFLVGIFCAFAHQYELSSNREAGLGRFDICLRPFTPGTKGLIFEVKRATSNKKEVVEPLLQAALEQVEIKKYGYQLKEGGLTEFTAVAVVFCNKELFFRYAVLPIP